MIFPRRLWQLLVVTAMAIPAGAVAPMAGAVPASGAQCAEVSIPVALSAGAEKASRIAGTYCAPAGEPASVLQILVPGATYDRSYWDFPGFDGRYSYVAHATRAGQATLAIDPIGVGKSSLPVGWQVSALSAAQALHEGPFR